MSNHSKNIARKTWKKGILHLTVDGCGLVSLWDNKMDTNSYLKLKLTKKQIKAIKKTKRKNGYTP